MCLNLSYCGASLTAAPRTQAQLQQELRARAGHLLGVRERWRRSSWERGLIIGETIALPASLFADDDADESVVTGSSGWIRARRESSERHRAFPKVYAMC
ncbi:hypothetical protein ON010_g10496 [Phytophthora cinnamomi]|nr:hypothetical protein ON010_g10496 [Phytophthora cinnamomi]